MGCERALKMVLGQLREPSWLTGTPSELPHAINIIARDGVEVRDGAHWLDVMRTEAGTILSSLWYA